MIEAYIFCMEFKLWIESSFNDLYQSTVLAFPKTEYRQHATDPIKINKITWSPYLGVKTLFIKGLAQNENREYQPIVLFKNVKYHSGIDAPNLIKLHTEGKDFLLEKLSLENSDILVNCQCKDFQWRLRHFDSVDKSLYGKDRKKYEALYRPGSANPMEMPGMCKHIIKLMKAIRETGLVE